MRKSFVINGKTVRPAELTFNNVCKMEEMGASLTDAQNRSMSLIRAYLAICMNVPQEIAGKELEAHVIGGGGIEDIADAMSEAIEESGFFQALNKTEEEKTTAVENKKK